MIQTDFGVITMGKEVVLAYNCGPYKEKIKIIADSLGVNLREVNPLEFCAPLQELAENRSVKPCFGVSFAETMLVFANFSEDKLDEFLAYLSSKGIKIPLKAVLTVTNMTWSSLYLRDHLLDEHEKMVKFMNSKKEGKR